jgi:hypothetical protein
VLNVAFRVDEDGLPPLDPVFAALLGLGKTPKTYPFSYGTGDIVGRCYSAAIAGARKSGGGAGCSVNWR